MFTKRILAIFFILSICLVLFLTEQNICHASLIMEGQLIEYGKKTTPEQKVKMTLRIYDDEFGGQILYEEKQDVAVDSGKFIFTFEKGNVRVRKKNLSQAMESMWVEVESSGHIMRPRINLAQIGGAVYDLAGDDASIVRANLRTSGDSILIIDNDGVSLGTSTPTEKLNIDGNVRIRSDEPLLILEDTTLDGLRPRVRFLNNEGNFDSDDRGVQKFGFYSLFSSTRQYDAVLNVYGKAAGSWGHYTSITNNGTDGEIKTDSGDLNLSSGSGQVKVDSNLHITGDVQIDGVVTGNARKGTYSMTGSGFTPKSSSTVYYVDSHFDLVNLGNNPSAFYATVHIPNGTWVTYVSCWWEDQSPDAAVFDLVRIKLSTSEKQIMAHMVSWWNDSGRHLQFAPNSSDNNSPNFISYPIIDNDTYAYQIILNLPALDGDDQCGIGGIRIKYTYP